MSVKLSHVSFVRTQQIPLWFAVSQKEMGAMVDKICDEDTSVEEYYQIVISTWGWTNGARSRTKKLHPSRALAYVNKLFSGGWIDDSTYHLMYSSVRSLLQKNSWPGYVEWEVVPFSFANINEALVSHVDPLLNKK